MAPSFMAPELRRERESSLLDINELTTLLDGGDDVTKTRRKMRRAMPLI